MTNRIQITDSLMDAVVKLSDGNPGAVSVLMQIQKKMGPEVLEPILNMDDMNMRGSAIWIGYKDYCGQDVDKFIKALHTRDPEMVAMINKHGGHGGEPVSTGLRGLGEIS